MDLDTELEFIANRDCRYCWKQSPPDPTAFPFDQPSDLKGCLFCLQAAIGVPKSDSGQRMLEELLCYNCLVLAKIEGISTCCWYPMGRIARDEESVSDEGDETV
jgi:hypothetical protein